MEDVEEVENVQVVSKVSRTGNALSINIPKKVVDIMKIEFGDYLKVNFMSKVGKSKIVKKAKRLPEI